MPRLWLGSCQAANLNLAAKCFGGSLQDGGKRARLGRRLVAGAAAVSVDAAEPDSA